MEKITSPKQLQLEILKDLYNAEVLSVSELLYFKKMCRTKAIQELIHNYLYDCRAHITVLEDLLEERNSSLFDDHCRTMKSLIKESKKLVEKCAEGTVRDLAVITALQRICTCKNTAYRSLVKISEDPSDKRFAVKLQHILQQETDMEKDLQDLITETTNLKEPAI
ncbi:MAG: DUF892 family protein [Balneolaceae bacterium]|nr:DUF892 family protein [Balneolaceae bacterium]